MLKEAIFHDVKAAVENLGRDSTKLILERTDGNVPGDYATNIALVLSEPDFAEVLADKLPQYNAQALRGFVNISIPKELLYKELSYIISEKEAYGSSSLGNEEKVNVEFISANPTGPLTVGNARGGFLGDAISAVLKKTGHVVTREYYFNDSGTQIMNLVSSVQAHAEGNVSEDTQYKGQYMQDLADHLKDNLSQSDIGERIIKEIFERHIKQAISRMGIHFDVWSNERALIESGDVNKTFERLSKAGLTYEQDGALWARTEQLGDTRDRVLRKSSGDITYLGTDIAYHIDMLEKRGFERAIKIWGADHAAQAPSLEKIIEKLLPEKKMEFVIMQFVRLIKGGEEFKISKRAGTYVTVEELLDEIGVDAARWYMLSRASKTHIDLDIDSAKEQSQKNPVYYVQYSYARAHQIVEKVNSENAELKHEDIASLNHDAEIELIKKLSEYPEVLENIATSFPKTKTYEVHKLAQYSYELANTFHAFYENCLILDEGVVHGARLQLVEAFQIVLKDGLSLLGISSPERM